MILVIFYLYLVHFNYICALCKVDGCKNPLCRYGHSDNEILFHPLTFKTLLCRDFLNGKCNKDLCPRSHSYLTDFRIIYKADDPSVKKILELGTNLYTFKPDSLWDKYLPLEFNLGTYKINQCPLSSHCKLDRPLCLNYHDNTDRRRHPNKFNYMPVHCSHVFVNGQWGNPVNCPEVIIMVNYRVTNAKHAIHLMNTIIALVNIKLTIVKIKTIASILLHVRLSMIRILFTKMQWLISK
jgi:hypothetical protein